MSCENPLCDKNDKFQKTFKDLGYNEETYHFELTEEKDAQVLTPNEIISRMNSFSCDHFEKMDLPGLYFLLAYFIDKNRYDDVQSIIEIPGFNVNKEHNVFKGYTAIAFAMDAFVILKSLSGTNHFMLIQMLLESGAKCNYNITSSGLRVPLLFFPVKFLLHNIVRLLLNYGVTISERSNCKEGYSVLHYLIKFAFLNTANERILKLKIQMFQLLCSNGANINEKLNSNGFTPLHLLIAEERTNLVELMSAILTGLANVNAKTYDEDAVIHTLIKKYIAFIDEITTDGSNEKTALEKVDDEIINEDDPINGNINEENSENESISQENSSNGNINEENSENESISQENSRNGNINEGNSKKESINEENSDSESIDEKNFDKENADQFFTNDLYSALKMLIEYNVNVNAKDKDGNTPLHLMLNMKTYDSSAFNMICALIENKADLFAKNKAGDIPLNLFIANLNNYPLEAFCEILNRFARFDNRKTGKMSSLHMLFELCFEKLRVKKFFKSLLLLLKDGANVNAKDSNGNTALHLLVNNFIDKFEINDHARALKTFINNGADITIKNKEGVTPLSILSTEPKYHPHLFFEVLEDAIVNCTINTDTKHQARMENATVTGEIESTRLHQLFYKLPEINDSTIERKINIMNLLILSGIDVNAKDNDGNTVLLILLLPQNKLTDENLQKIFNFLINSEANVNVQNNDELSPLQLIVTSSYSFETQLTVMSRLVDEGANIFKSGVLERVMQDLNSEKQISWSTNYDSKQLASFCKLSWRVVDKPDSEGWTPLFHATRSCHFEFITALVEEGAKVDRICNGRSVIQELIKKQPEDLHTLINMFVAAKYLMIENGVDLNHIDSHGKTIFHDILPQNWESSEQWLRIMPNIIDLILDAGFDLKAKDSNGETVLDLLIKVSTVNPNQYEPILLAFCRYAIKVECITNQNLRLSSIWEEIFNLYEKTLHSKYELFSYENYCKHEIQEMKNCYLSSINWFCVNDNNISIHDILLEPAGNFYEMSDISNLKLHHLHLFENQFDKYGVMIYHKIKNMQMQKEDGLSLGG